MLRDLALAIFPERPPRARARDQVRVVAHPLRAIHPGARLQHAGVIMIVRGKQTRTADLIARADEVVIEEGVRDPGVPRHPEIGEPAESTHAVREREIRLCIERDRRGTCRLVQRARCGGKGHKDRRSLVHPEWMYKRFAR